MKSVSFIHVIPALLLTIGIVQAGWEEDVRVEFKTFADAMNSGKYAAIFESFTKRSSDDYRKLMLEHYAAAKEKQIDRMMPTDKDDKPYTVAALKALGNDEFWKVQIAFFKKHEKATSEALVKAHGALGTPLYSIGKAFREGERVFVLAEREFKIKGHVKMPYQVIEYVMENGKWGLEVPRDMLWELYSDPGRLEQGKQ